MFKKYFFSASTIILLFTSGCQAQQQPPLTASISHTDISAPLITAKPPSTPIPTPSPSPTPSTPILIPSSPAPTKEKQLLGTFQTKYNTKNNSRVNNLQLASKTINDFVLQPNETFSYNKTVGPTTKARGYKEAKIIVKGFEKKGYGGGVCQISSTLFNAATEAGLKIVERHPHSKKVYYVAEGKDAATSQGSLDFKFKNTKDYPIQIKSTVEDGIVTVSIFEFLVTV